MVGMIPRDYGEIVEKGWQYVEMMEHQIRADEIARMNRS
jgi:hypothetical protein